MRTTIFCEQVIHEYYNLNLKSLFHNFNKFYKSMLLLIYKLECVRIVPKILSDGMQTIICWVIRETNLFIN